MVSDNPGHLGQGHARLVALIPTLDTFRTEDWLPPIPTLITFRSEVAPGPSHLGTGRNAVKT